MDKRIYDEIHANDIYAGLESFCKHAGIKPMLHLGSANHDVPFDVIIGNNKPRLIIEIGSYLGSSAILMANTLKKHGVEDFTIICIDTWLGSPENYVNPEDEEHNILKHAKHGYPVMYYQFLLNIKEAGLENYIIPIPNTSYNAITIIKHIFDKYNLQACMIYDDGAHDTHSVQQDVFYYYQFLKPGGIMCGDDLVWKTVEAGVINALHDLNIPLENLQAFEPNKIFWFFTK